MVQDGINQENRPYEMTTKIGLIGDVHACAAPLEEALSIFRQENVAMVLCAGDIAGYGTELTQTVQLLMQSKCTAILGNHDAWYLDKSPEDPVGKYFTQLPRMWESVIEGVHIYAVHASPPDSLIRGVRLLDENGDILPGERECWARELEKYPFDVLIMGHTHQVFAEQLGGKLIVNPGSTKFNHTCAILSLPEMKVRVLPLSGKEPLKAWNWGMMTRS